MTDVFMHSLIKFTPQYPPLQSTSDSQTSENSGALFENVGAALAAAAATFFFI